MMAFDYKKEYKEFYMPKRTPSIVTVPEMNYIAVRGSGNPNDEDGEYKRAIGLLYGIAFTIKMAGEAEDRDPASDQKEERQLTRGHPLSRRSKWKVVSSDL